MIITHELPAHAGAIEALLDSSFGPKRHTKTVYKLRRGVPHLPDLSFVAMADDGQGGQRLVATIRYWPVMIGGSVAAIMLGPIAVDPAWRSEGLGGKLIRHSLAAAKVLGHRICVLVGDAPYYVRFGFRRDLATGLSLPGPVDPDRFQALELVEGAMTGLTGMVGRALPARSAPARTAAVRTAPLRTGTARTTPLRSVVMGQAAGDPAVPALAAVGTGAVGTGSVAMTPAAGLPAPALEPATMMAGATPAAGVDSLPTAPARRSLVRRAATR
ncbi:MAG: hypothetical protein RLY86_3799 [Pseudomonadota bacterium]|jgi:predicted N-acetyltransferase YhbS